MGCSFAKLFGIAVSVCEALAFHRKRQTFIKVASSASIALSVIRASTGSGGHDTIILGTANDGAIASAIAVTVGPTLPGFVWRRDAVTGVTSFVRQTFGILNAVNTSIIGVVGVVCVIRVVCVVDEVVRLVWLVIATSRKNQDEKKWQNAFHRFRPC